MEKRIEINGVWYVREEQQFVGLDTKNDPPKEVDPDQHDWEPIPHRGIEINNYGAGWKLEVGVLDTNEKFSMPHIELFHRTTPDSDWISEETMDNSSWMIGVVEGSKQSLSHLEEYRPDLQAAIIYACQQMNKKGWI